MIVPSYTCVLCVANVEEDIRHLFFSYLFSDACWTYLGIHWDLSLDFQSMILNARLRFNSVIFREIFIVGSWAIWCHRNDIIFDDSALSFAKWRTFFIRELDLVLLRAKPRIADKIRVYMSNLFSQLFSSLIL
jgi:hypothetical protein